MFLIFIIRIASGLAAATVGAGESCGGEKGVVCDAGLACAHNQFIKGSPGVCLQVSEAGGPCEEQLDPKFFHMCTTGTECVLMGESKLCIKLANENEPCNETTGPANMHVCTMGLQCIVPESPQGSIGGTCLKFPV